ncbi:MAG: sulfatase-like hydrolase/transferase [Victivallales bacterium]|nr:sulfatase-like hydrolase/transferase [Victivallales bacterium]
MNKDILVFVSDQHNATVMESAGDRYISTPNMTRLAREGVEYTNAYTPCPLCVPARMAFLTGQMASKTGIFGNDNVLSSEQATIAHCLGAEGYETVLCGRMHFRGQDQLHGFIKRPIGDFTPCYGGRGGLLRDDLGPYASTPSGNVTKHYGGGTSPVLEYDHAVTKAAVQYLAEEQHDKPIFMVVGIYGPHHTYVAPLGLYRKYCDLIDPPASDSVEAFDLHPCVKASLRDFTKDETHRMRAAYYGMIEHVDSLIGKVKEAWDSHLERNDRQGLFCYTSDHGDMAGEKGLWFKQLFYEESARVPLIFAGDGAAQGKQVNTPASLLDISPTLCQLAGAIFLPDQDGVSLVPSLESGKGDPERYVISEVLYNGLGRMIRYRNWKLISFAGWEEEDQLFNLEDDPGEYTNVISANSEIVKKMRGMVTEPWNPNEIMTDQERRSKHLGILAEWGARSGAEEPYRWKVPKESWALPEK